MESQREILETELQEVLDGELGSLAQEEGLDPARLTEDAVEAESTLLASARNSWSKVEELRDSRDALSRYTPVEGSMRAILRRPTRWLLGITVGVLVAILVLDRIANAPSFLFVFGGLVPLLVGVFDATRRDQRNEAERGRELGIVKERLHAAEVNFRRELREAGIQPWVREQMNAFIASSYSTSLHFRDASGLAEVDDPGSEVPTGARDRLAETIERMPGGAIGLSGPRGVGKTTLMRSICSGEEDESEVLSVVVDAPVRYDAREFVLHMFAQVCAQVLGPKRVAGLRNWSHLGANSEIAGPAYPAILGPAALGVGVLLAMLSFLSSSINAPSLLVLAVAFGATGYVLSFFSFTRDRGGIRRLLGIPPRATDDEREDEKLDDKETAALRLRQIWFQQSFSSGWSGSLKVPVGIEGSLNQSRELAEQQLSFPEIVDLLKEFLKQVSSGRQVRIGIDELDKMDDETARQFLNEIKVVFRIPRGFFLVSISEDAMSFFERRGLLPFRDVFDSSFDDVLDVPQLDLEQSRQLLERRIVDLPVPFACLLHCLSGGLPRDMIRVARTLVTLGEGISLDAATAELTGKILEGRVRAARVAARRFGVGEHATVLALWLERLEIAGADPASLLDLCGDFEESVLRRLNGTGSVSPLSEDDQELQSLATQLVAFSYHVATVRQLFSGLVDSERVEAIMVAGGDGEVASTVDRLAKIHQILSSDLSFAWEEVSKFRESQGLEPLPYPRLRAASPA